MAFTILNIKLNRVRVIGVAKQEFEAGVHECSLIVQCAREKHTFGAAHEQNFRVTLDAADSVVRDGEFGSIGVEYAVPLPGLPRYLNVPIFVYVQ